MSLHDRVTRLERANTPGPHEIRIIGGLTNGVSPIACIDGQPIERATGEGDDAFQVRVRSMAKRGDWIVWGGLG